MKLGAREMFKPQGQTFIFPDIGGEFVKFSALWKKVEAELSPEDYLVFCGDYIGYGSGNLSTLILLQKIKNEHANTYFIEGNHESSLLGFLKNDNRNNFYDREFIFSELIERGYSSGSRDTFKMFLKDYKIHFLEELIPYFETEEFLITHAPFPAPPHPEMKEGVLEDLQFDLLHNFVEKEQEKIRGTNKWLICGHQNNFGLRKEPSIYVEEKRMFLDTSYRGNKQYALVMPSLRIIDNE